MALIFITCPRAGYEVPTGMEADREGFAALKPLVYRMRCPACGSEHAWSKGIARLAEGSARPAAAPAPPSRRQSEPIPGLGPQPTVPQAHAPRIVHPQATRPQEDEADTEVRFSRFARLAARFKRIR